MCERDLQGVCALINNYGKQRLKSVLAIWRRKVDPGKIGRHIYKFQ